VTPPPPACNLCGATGASRFRRDGDFTILRCEGCGLRYLDPQPTAEQLDALYSHSYFENDASVRQGYQSYAAEVDNHRATFETRLRYLSPPSGKLLDVGAATGVFVERARARGWQAEGVEPSEWAATFAREELRQPVRTTTLEAAAFPDRSFDAVTMWEVIEHLPDPRNTLREIARVLKPGGTLALSTPDAGSAVARLSGQAWLGWRKIPEHLFYFDVPSLKRYLDETGFEWVSHRYVSITVTLGFALGRLGSLVGLPWLERLPGPLANTNVPINPLYDLMVVARRRDDTP
jgi:2-polyprenyl-3-methyl-5-hydroxy-6-metoxy-1,4-benzoquinol methylase